MMKKIANVLIIGIIILSMTFPFAGCNKVPELTRKNSEGWTVIFFDRRADEPYIKISLSDYLNHSYDEQVQMVVFHYEYKEYWDSAQFECVPEPSLRYKDGNSYSDYYAIYKFGSKKRDPSRPSYNQWVGGECLWLPGEYRIRYEIASPEYRETHIGHYQDMVEIYITVLIENR